jgi:hypothetical protein
MFVLGNVVFVYAEAEDLLATMDELAAEPVTPIHCAPLRRLLWRRKILVTTAAPIDREIEPLWRSGWR